MKTIELSDEQRAKLLEMCQALFPEYRYNKETSYGGIVFHHLNEYPGMLFGSKSDGSDSDTYITASLFIHWFEFCMTHLQNSLYHEIAKSSKIGIDTWNYKLMGQVNFHAFRSNGIAGHPVDYLYNEFKKLIL